MVKGEMTKLRYMWKANKLHTSRKQIGSTLCAFQYISIHPGKGKGNNNTHVILCSNVQSNLDISKLIGLFYKFKIPKVQINLHFG